MKITFRIILVLALLLVAGCSVLGLFGLFIGGTEHRQTMPAQKTYVWQKQIENTK
jgi:hypothetical protein